MAPKKLYGIEVKADYGHFRKNFTTSSPLTYGVPPRTALAGFLGAILGLPRDDERNYHEVFSRDNSSIALVNDPQDNTQKQTVNLNLLKIKGETEKLVKLDTPPEEITRSQVPFEVIRNPRYRIYFNSSELTEEDVNLLKNEKSVYTPYLGISEYIADYEFLGEFEPAKSKGETTVDSVVPADAEIRFETGKKYIKESFSMFMNTSREVQEFGEVLYEENGDGVIKASGKYFKANGENLVFLE